MNIKRIKKNYLAFIDDPLNGGPDKLSLLDYLTLPENLSILEVGPGSGQMLAEAINISKTKKLPDKYFVIDIDNMVLNELKNHPIIGTYEQINYCHGDILKSPYPSNFFDIINLSAIMHECSTYQGGQQAVEQLINIIVKLVKHNGIVIFRDLECTNFHEITKCELSGMPIVAFFYIFLRKFLDQKYCHFTKPAYYDKKNISLYIQGKKYTIEEYLFSHQINEQSNSILLEAPVGFIKEIQRHFLTFLAAYIPEYFYEIKEIDTNKNISIYFEKNSSFSNFILCCEQNNVPYNFLNKNSIQIKKHHLFIIENCLTKKFLQLLQPHQITIPTRHAGTLKKFLVREKFPYVENQNQFTLTLDIILLLDNWLMDLNYQSNSDINILDWSRREGDEYYYFDNWQKILQLFIKASLRLINSPSHMSDTYSCLTPIETSFAPRPLYIKILKRFFKAHDEKYSHAESEGKRIIHFCQLSLETAKPQIINFINTHCCEQKDEDLLMQLNNL